MTECRVPDRGDAIEVGVGELAVGREPQTLTTAALGSCVGVTLWDPFTHNGALAHVMLPEGLETSRGGPENRFATVAVPKMIRMLEAMGSSPSILVAKLVGGSAMFKGDSAMTAIGERNVDAVDRELKAFHIPVMARDVGGSHARTVELHLDSGTLLVRSYQFGVKEL